MATQKYLDNTGLAYFWGKIKSWVTGRGYITSSGSITGNAATATRLAGPKHSYTTAANAAKNWYRIANANTSQIDTTKPLHVQFMLTAYNTSVNKDYYQRWFVDCEVFGRQSGLRVFGNSSVPFQYVRVLYENTDASVTTSNRPAIDIYLNYVIASASNIEIEEINNSGFDFLADGVLAVSTVPSGFESRQVSVNASGVQYAYSCDWSSRVRLQRSNITANATLANDDTYRVKVLNCTNAITITVPSIDSDYAWFLIKNFNAASTNKNVTVHPSTTSVLIDDSNADIVLKPGEWVIIASKAANSYTLISDGRWKSQKADKATTLAGYGITDAKIANGTITLGSNSITPLISHQALPTLSKTDSGSGNAVTAISVSNHAITVTKGSTFLTSHQSLSDLGIGNVKNYDQSKAIKSITRSGTTFTYTCLDNTTGTFTQQDSNTDTLVTQNVSTANEEHPILLTITKDANANQGAKTSIFAAAVKVNPSTGTVTATKFSGPLTGNVTGNCSGSSGSCTGNAATATKLAGPKHSYTVAKSAAKNWYRIANANVSQTEATNTLHVQFMVTAYNSGQDTGYYERWFVDCEVFGRNAGIRIFGNAGAPFTQARVLYENTIADIDANDRPAIDLYLNYVMSNAATTVVVEELYNSGWTFVADGALSASSVPTGFENVASGVRNNGVERCSFADYVPYLNRQFSNITAAFTLADSSTYRSRTLNCTGTFTITIPSINSGYMWCVIKNKNTSSGVITLHPSTTSVLIDGSNTDITLQPMEYVCIHSAGANNYSLIADGRWMSKKADKATTLAGYGIADAKIASGVITLGSSTITPLTSSSSLNAAKLTGTASVNTTGTASNVTGTVAIANGGTGHGAQLVESTASNFNSYTESGDYHVGFPSGTANAPVASSDKLDCVLMVRKIGASASVSSASRYTQIAIVQNSTTSNQLRIFARKGYSDTGNWTAWSEVAFAENFCDLSTEQTISGCNKIISGNDKGWRCTSTNGTQEMRFCVGSGGTNRGIWDVKLNKWTLQMNNTDAYLNGQVNSGSDERLKTKIEPMPDELLDAWDEINWNQFKYLAEVESKGEEDAAIHAGIIAQRVVEAFARHGLDAEKYGFIGRDIPEDGSDGFWMVRYLEALALEAAYQRRRADRLEARIAALEEAMNG